MKPLIYGKKDTNIKSYEENRLRKAVKGSLEAVDFPYTTSVFGDYDFVHFVSVDDMNKINDAKRENLPIIMSALYCESEKHAALTTTHLNKKTLKSKVKKCLNLADVVLVPGVRAKQFLESQGIISKIELFPCPVKLERVESEEQNDEAQSYRQQLNNKIDCVVCVGDYTNKVEVLSFLEIAELCYSVKFCFIGSNYSNLVANKYAKVAPKNVEFKSLTDDETYCDALKRSKIFLVLDPRRAESLNTLEAMVAKTQLVIYNNRQLQSDSFLKDGKNCYIRGGIYDLADCIDKFIKNKIVSTVDGAHLAAVNFNYKNSGERLVRVYKSLIENKKENKFYYD